MNCPNCNTQNIPDDAIFCPNCGKKIVLKKRSSNIQKNSAINKKSSKEEISTITMHRPSWGYWGAMILSTITPGFNIIMLLLFYNDTEKKVAVIGGIIIDILWVLIYVILGII